MYGVVVERAMLGLLASLGSSRTILAYGFQIIRKELRDTPKTATYGKRSVRNLLLQSYDSLVRAHEFQLTPVIEAIAEEYARNYAGGIAVRKLSADFLIVACAAIHHLDVVVTEDSHSMASAPALRAYEKVNKVNSLRTPRFYKLEKLQRLLNWYGNGRIP